MVLKLVYIAILFMCIYPLESAWYRNRNENQDQTIARPGCNPKCGNVSIIFPFGMNDPKCYASKAFEIECRHNNNTSEGGKPVPYLKNINLEVMYIDVAEGAVAIKNPIFHLGKNCAMTNTGINLEGSPFVYSQNYNTFLAVGCQNAAFMMSNDDNILTACLSMCYDDLKNGNDIDIASCRGKYCCETSLPPNLSAYNTSFETVEVKATIEPECDYVMIRADYDLFNYVYDEYNSSYWTPTLGDLKSVKDVPAMLEWEIPIHTPNNSFPDFPGYGDASYNCSYTNITSSQYSHSGWRCSCRDGFEGNPYIENGCKGTYCEAQGTSDMMSV